MKRCSVQRCAPRESSCLRANGALCVVIVRRLGRYRRGGGHGWTGSLVPLDDVSRDGSRATSWGGRAGVAERRVIGLWSRRARCIGRRTRWSPSRSACTRVRSRLRQGAGEVRDAARASARWADCECGGERARSLTGGVASGGGGVRAGGDGWAVGRAARTARPVVALTEVLAFRTRRRELPDASGAQLAHELEVAFGVRLEPPHVEKGVWGSWAELVVLARGRAKRRPSPTAARPRAPPPAGEAARRVRPGARWF